MAANPRSTTMESRTAGNGSHTHRTAKIVELVGSSTKSFDAAIRNVLADASESTRGITGCTVENMTIRCDNGDIKEYRVTVKVAFGIERTPPATAR